MKVVEKKLLHLYREMTDDDQHALIRYAEFLSEAKVEKSVELVTPTLIPAAENESVVGALKRLSASYPMIDKAKMLDQTSSLMSDHLLRGKAKKEVIKEFDVLFEQEYKKLERENKSND